MTKGLNNQKKDYLCLINNDMHLLKRTIQWTIGIICGLLLGLQICIHIPVVQEWTGNAVASAMQSIWGWDISIGRIRFGLGNRVIIDDIKLKDKQDSLMVHASRLAAKVELLPLAQGKISISNAQMFGTHAYLYQKSPDDKPNFQFLIDTFSSNDTTSKPLDLRVGNILLRRVSVHWDRQWMPHETQGRLDPNHLRLTDITMTAHLRALKNDSLNFTLKRFSFKEQSGFAIDNIGFSAVMGRNRAKVDKLLVALPHSTISVPSFTASWPGDTDRSDIRQWICRASWKGKADITFTPSDIRSIVPRLAHAHSDIRLSFSASGQDAAITVPDLRITNGGSLDLQSKVSVNNLPDNPQCTIDITRLQTSAELQHFITEELSGNAREVSPLITRLDTIRLSGRMQFSKHHQSASMHIANRLVNLSINASAKEWNEFKGTITSPEILWGKLVSDDARHAHNMASADIEVGGTIKDSKGNTGIEIRATLPRLSIKGCNYNDIRILGKLSGKTLSIEAAVPEDDGDMHGEFSLVLAPTLHFTGKAIASGFPTEKLGLENIYPQARMSLCTDIMLSGSNIDDISGELKLSDYTVETSGGDTVIDHLDVLALNTNVNGTGIRTIEISSTPLNISAQGRFKFSTMAGTVQNILHQKIPNLIPYKKIRTQADSVSFAAEIQDTVLLNRFTKAKIYIPQKATISGAIYGYDSVGVHAHIPSLHVNNEDLRNCTLKIRGTSQILTTHLTTERRQKHGFVDFSLKANAYDNKLRVIAGLDNKRKPRIFGEMDVTATFSGIHDGEHQVKAWIAPSDIVILDTVWRIHPANITWNEQVLSISGFKINQSKHRGIEIHGQASAKDSDTLNLKLQNINTEYILDLVNFKSVEFSGLASGIANVSKLFSNPQAKADITVDGFCFNKAPLGTLTAHAQWGAIPDFLTLDASIADTAENHLSTITGGFNIGSKTVPDGLDLKVNTKRFNLAFLNLFTQGIFDDFQGRASGYCRIFGPFKGIDLEGSLMLDHATCRLPMLGTTYRIERDSVHLRPGEINIKARLVDELSPSNAFMPKIDWTSVSAFGFVNTTPHTAILEGTLRHNHFKDLTYEFNAYANKFLGYDFKDFGEDSFYATCLATGEIGIRGIPGRLNVDINAVPEAGTTFVYNVSTPEALTEAKFITINSRGEKAQDNLPLTTADRRTDGTPAKEHETDNKNLQTDNAAGTASDLFINFYLQLTPDARIKLLMDRKSGDMIELAGRGRITAKYHNKGRFNIFGTYRIQDGSYRLSIQDIIRKDFRFQQDGTITFGGNAMKADLNLKAVYTVNGVSLDDLATSSLGFSKTRVDCVMNLTGRPEQPVVTFDFNLPDATEDERQMVRSIVSTEEERNMQAIYLLGLGRFYRFETEGNDQGGLAMNSLVSSTLSSQLNQFITHAVGSNNWNFGTSLKTGEDGWRNMDVEGMLSGSLFNNRLLLTGNFGYREKYYTQRNFITDVSVEYLITKNGSISLKAFNQANDRYFVQSSLNTQGIGIQFKKDFNRLSDLFLWIMPKKTREKK